MSAVFMRKGRDRTTGRSASITLTAPHESDGQRPAGISHDLSCTV